MGTKNEKLSKLMKLRHKLARERREIYYNLLGREKKLKYSEFLKNRSIVEDNIVGYKVSFQVSYISDTYDNILETDYQTFEIFAFKSPETKTFIERDLYAMVGDMKDSNNKNLNIRLKEALSSGKGIKADFDRIDLSKARGMEQINNINDKTKLIEVYEKLREGGYYIKGLDLKTNLKKIENHKIKGRSKMYYDILHFM